MNFVFFAAAIAGTAMAAFAADDSPIGVFDSGLGGLTVLERLLDVDQVDNATGLYGPDGVPDLAHERFIYLGDQANMPYGDYAAEGKSDYLRKLILEDAKFLLATNYYRCDNETTPGGVKKRAKIIVIACNTATAWGLDDVRRHLASSGDNTRVVGVIEAGVRATLDHVAAKSGGAPFAIGVMATPGTIASGAYERTIRAELKARGVKSEVAVVSQGCAGLADAVETGSPTADAIAGSNLVSLVERHRAAGSAVPIRAVILGCTHYPFVLSALEKTVSELRAKGAPLADDFRFIDPAFYTAAECHRILRETGRLAERKDPARVEAFLSVANPALPPECLTSDGQLTRKFKYGRDTGSDAVTTKPVPFTRKRFGDDVFRNIGRLLPMAAACAFGAEFFVSPDGDDAASGSAARPWRTIQRAADVAKAGDTVTIRGGTYREWVKPANAGREDAPITYRAAAGEKVVVTGADPVTRWVRRDDGLWEASVPHPSSPIPHLSFNPFTDFISGDWFVPKKDKRYFRTRLIQNGRALELFEAGVLSAEKAKSPPLMRGQAALVPDADCGRIVAAFHDDPNVAVPELVVRPACFYPVKTHRDYIRLQGISFVNAAPNWAPPTAEQMGVAGTHWSRGWVIEDCEISGSPCSGLTLGKYGDEFDNIGGSAESHAASIARAMTNGLERVGHHIVRRCRIRDCGQAGICGAFGGAFSVIEDCDIGYCYWQKEYYGAEMGCIKLHNAVDAVIQRCRLHHCGFAGIWLDWMAQGAIVRNNVFWHNERDLYLEVNHGPILVEGNDILSGLSFKSCGQGAAFVGNRIAGAYRYWNDSRNTPVCKPHSVFLQSPNVVAPCGTGDFVFINNMLAYDPKFKNEEYPSRFEDNWMIPPECWKVDDETGVLTVTPPEGLTQPEFKPVDAKRLGRPRFVEQDFPAPAAALPALGGGVYDLRCEYQTEPLGVVKPRFFWKYSGARPAAWKMTVGDGERVIASQEACEHLYVEPQLELEPWKRYWWSVDGVKGAFVTGIEKWRMPFFYPDWKRDEREYWIARRKVKLHGAKSVIVAVCSRGNHRLYVNGRPASEGFGPNRSHIEDGVLLAETYDVTQLVKDGENDFAVFVNDGWLRIKTCSQDKTSCLSIDGRAETADGTVAIDSSEPWTVSKSGDRTVGGRRHSSNYGGGEYLCDLPVETDAQSGVPVTGENFSVSCSIASRDAVVKKVVPASIVPYGETGDAGAAPVWKIDMGEAFTGVMKLKLKGRKGDVAKMTVSDNFVDTCNFGQEWNYAFCGGNGEFENRLNWMSGRFFYLSGCEKPSKDDITGFAMTCAGKRTGAFEGDVDVEKVVALDNDTFAVCTMSGVTMDCPHRERLGYGEASLSSMWGDGLPYFDTAAFYYAYLLKWASSQRPDGSIPQVSPDGRGWGGIFWSCYPVYGLAEFCRLYPDSRLVDTMRPVIEKWLDFLDAHVKDGVFHRYDKRKGYSLGDWAYPETDTKNWGDWGNTREGEFFNNAAYAWAIVRALEVPGLVTDAKRREELLRRHAALAAAIDRTWFADGLYVSADARYQAMGLVCGAAEAGGHREATEKAVLDIVERKGFVDGGSPSYHVILRILCGSERGRLLALRTFRRREFPGYLHFADEGFNTLPEHWLYGRNSRGSMMHTCYTGAAGFPIRGFAGIDVVGNKVTVKPFLSDALPRYSARMETLYGTLAVKVETAGGRRIVEVLLPAGCEGVLDCGEKRPLRTGMNRFDGVFYDANGKNEAYFTESQNSVANFYGHNR